MWCVPKIVTWATGDKAKNLSAASFVIGGQGKWPLGPLEEVCPARGHLRRRRRRREAAGRPPPPSLLPFHAFPHEGPHTHTEEGRVPLLTRLAQGEECLCGVCGLGVQGRGVTGLGGLPRPSRVSPALVPVSCHTRLLPRNRLRLNIW